VIYREVCLKHIINKSVLVDFSMCHPDLIGCDPDL